MSLTVRIENTDFDSKIEIPNATRPENCTIWLELSLHLQQVNGTSFTRGGQTYRTQNWTSGEWNQYRYLYTHITQHWWSTQFWLRSPVSFNEMNLPLAGPTHRPNFQCKLRISLQSDATARNHATIRVVRLVDDERAMRSASRTYDNRDIEATYREGIPHITAVHEVGHLLKLQHPGLRNRLPACVADGDAEECYKPRNETMGGGLDMIPEYANPWRKRLASHTNTNERDWEVVRNEIAPVRLSAERLVRDIVNGSRDRMRDRLIRSADGL